ncbi:cytochrome P450 [Aspergillus caelatus]|uniref:Cytochrome P450 n=1 Tax=Aspergillus caelatus TaxID=61420 RepID=A0A5N7A7D9_9EURO|nr:cytochrome P450 [Aspergillus caelatus]KAE8365754.1 cytochrome P450 [Aspergillus caelatus]
MNLLIIIYAVLAALCCYIVLTVYEQVRSPLRDIPGPFVARFSSLWYLYKSYRGNFHHENIELHRKHGRIVRIAPGTYSISEPDKAVYGAGSRFPKSDWYQAWKHPDLVTLFADTNIKRHNDSRRRVQNLYSLSSLVSYEAPVNDCNAILCRKLRDFATTGEVINLTYWLQCYAFDAVGCITFSKRFGFLDEGKDIGGMIEANAQLLLYSTAAGHYPSLHQYLYPLLERIPGTGASGLRKITSAVYDMISLRRRLRGNGEKDKSRVDNQAGPQDFLDRIMNAQDADPTKVTNSHIFMLGWGNISAGSDTTGVTLSSILYYLIQNPQTMRRLLDEVSHVRSAGGCTKESVSFAQAQDMPYLQACIKEGMRLHSATGLPLWRVVPEGGAEVCGRYFPGGSVVGINTWVAHYSEAVFGHDVGEFRPERWLETSGERLRAMGSYLIPFGVGSRTCIGRHISMLEISKLLLVVVQNFEIEMVDDKEGWKTLNHWFVMPLNFNVKLKPRV